MTYFQNEIWDTGGDGRITITGDIYSTADPFSIYINSTPLEVIEFATAQTEIKNNLNVLGTISINGIPINGGNTFTEIIIEKDGDPLIFGTLSVPLSGVFEDYLFVDLTDVTGLVISGDTRLNGYLEMEGNGFLSRSANNQQGFDVYININSTTLSIYSDATNIAIQSFSDLITPANSLNAFIAEGRLSISSDTELSISTPNSQSFKVNNEIVPSLNFTTTTASTNFSVDWYLGSVRKCIINADVTISFSNPIAGRTYILIIEQGTGGSRIPTLTGWNFGNNPPTWSTAVGAKDVVSAVYDGTEYLAALAVENA